MNNETIDNNETQGRGTTTALSQLQSWLPVLIARLLLFIYM